ncbi:hypothetical protein FQN60_015199 [Etheostoma spectabile]|uniref:non-specific serine/threonine protein kinase n=1 Tax=Etheostoma spectabile TaxID=54343 RepID=A0A5J5CXF8_9PERO|nr:hypothetical protein FQN60_015199 [Etheostoma spectabile]
MSTGTSGSGIFTDSSNSSKDQHAVKDKKMGKSQNETSTQSRFTSEFDSIERLGSGGFGRVYKARDKLLKKYYAVKIVCCVEKALREVGTLSDLLHCNIVRYYTFWMEASRYQWDSLAGSNSSVHIAQQIVSGVEYIHSKEHIHRDLKPENILFGLDGVVKIGDFGLVTKDDEDDSALMDRTENKGTTSYMAPEQREKYYDRRVDIFALGLIYFELLWKLSTGHERGVVWNDARSQKLPEDFLQTFPQENEIIKWMLCEKPEDRPDASKLKAELEKWAQTFSVQNLYENLNPTSAHRNEEMNPNVSDIWESLSSAQSMSTGTSGSGKFTDSSNSSKDQHVVKDKNMGKSQNETSTQSSVNIDRFTSDFTPMECLGSGGYGYVCKARHKLSEKDYAVKIVKYDEKALREVKILSDFRHDNIVRYFTTWTENTGYQWDSSAGSNSFFQFTVRAVLNGKAYPEGVGKNKKEAKQNAAKNALKRLMEEPVHPTEEAAETPSASAHPTSITQANYNCWLNEYCQKNNLTIRPVESTIPGPKNAIPCCSFVVDGKTYPAATGKTRKEAKEEAAKLVYDVICGSKPSEEKSDICEKITKDKGFTEDNFIGLVDHYCLKEKLIHDFILENKCGPPHDLHEKITKDKGFTEDNFIGLVDHYCLKEKLIHDFILENKCGPPHDPQFFYKLVINNKEYPVGEGKSVKEAKQKAAQLAWAALQEQTDWDSKNETSMQSRFTSEFEPMECLGSGGFGVVYKARHKLLEKDFAVKIVFCEEKALREVKTLSDLLHHNIVRYYTVWPEDSGYRWDSSAGSSAGSYSYSQSSIDNSSAKYLYIQMELCNTKTLKDWIDEKNNQSPQDTKRREESLSIAQQIVSGVEYIHSRKHIHRDLKPANILFGLDGEVKIGDFGLVTKDDDALMDRTENKGTPSYMAPEQRRKHYDRKVDIFALGLIYLELLWKVSTGHERRVVLDDARCQKLPNDFSKTFPQENHIIKLMLRENPEGRPDASQLKADLEKWAQTFSTKNVRQENATI